MKKKLTDEEIVKSLECCVIHRDNYPCDCGLENKICDDDNYLIEILDLIHRLQDKNKRLTEENFVLYRDRFTKKELDDISDCRVKKATAELQKQVEYWENETKIARRDIDEAVKDTAKEILCRLWNIGFECVDRLSALENGIQEIAKEKGVEVE